MNHTIIVDVTPIVRKLWNEYDGDKSQKQWLNKGTQKHIINMLDTQIKALTLNHEECISYTFNKNEKEIIINCEWLENENINTWNHEIKQDILLIMDYCNSKTLMAYTTTLFTAS